MKTSVLVIGLGRFGASAALELMALGHEVLAVDQNESIVNEIAPDVTHAVQLDAADEAALKAIGAAEFEHAIVAISSGVEASVFAVMALKQLGVGNVHREGGLRAPRGDPRSGWAPTGSCSRSARWASGSPTRSRSRTSWSTSTSRRGSASSRCGRRRGGSAAGSTTVGESLTPVALRRGDAVTVNPSRDEVIQEGDEVILIGKDDLIERLRVEPGERRSPGRRLASRTLSAQQAADRRRTR